MRTSEQARDPKGPRRRKDDHERPSEKERRTFLMNDTGNRQAPIRAVRRLEQPGFRIQLTVVGPSMG